MFIMEGKMDMKKHVTAVGAIHIGFGILGLIAAFTVLVVLIGSGLLVLSIEGDELPLTILASVAVFVTIFLAILSVPELIGGLGILNYKNWARYLVIVVSVLNLFNIPVGTAVGIYSIWVLMQDETETLFAAEASMEED
jgi:hypothetical protein